MSDIFALQDDITLAVVEALKVTFFGSEKAAVLRRYTKDAEAYELVSEGPLSREHVHGAGLEAGDRVSSRKRSTGSPTTRWPTPALATARGCQWFFGILPAEQTIPQSKSANSQALAIDDGLSDAYLSLAMITFFYEWDWQRAEEQFTQAITLNPNNAEALSYFAMFLAFAGRRRRGHRAEQESAHPGSARAAHQHEWRMDVLWRRDAGRGVTAGRQDDRE